MKTLLPILALVSALTVNAQTLPPLGIAASYGVIAATAVTNTGNSIVSGNLGLYPNGLSSITGFPPGTVIGTINAANTAASNAKAGVQAAYTNCQGQTPTATIATDLASTTHTAGVYTAASGTFSITGGGTLTLNGAGNPNSIFIFQTATTLVTSTSSAVVLTNGAQPGNVFWCIGSSATLGTTSIFVGDILAQTSITANTTANTNGSLYALTGAVTLSGNSIAAASFPSGLLSFNGVPLFATGPPAVSNCGVGPTVSLGANNNSGIINIGSAPKNNLGQEIPVLQCTLTWATAFTNPPSTTITMNDNPARRFATNNINANIAANSAAVMTFYFDTNAGSGSFSYVGF